MFPLEQGSNNGTRFGKRVARKPGPPLYQNPFRCSPASATGFATATATGSGRQCRPPNWCNLRVHIAAKNSINSRCNTKATGVKCTCHRCSNNSSRCSWPKESGFGMGNPGHERSVNKGYYWDYEGI